MLQHCCQSFQSDITLKFDPTFFLTFTFKLIREHDFYLHLKRLSEIKFNDSSRSFTIAEYENLKFQNIILNFLFFDFAQLVNCFVTKFVLRFNFVCYSFTVYLLFFFWFVTSSFNSPA